MTPNSRPSLPAVNGLMGTSLALIAVSTMLLFDCAPKTELPVQTREAFIPGSPKQVICRMQVAAFRTGLSFHFGHDQANDVIAFRLIGGEYEVEAVNLTGKANMSFACMCRLRMADRRGGREDAHALDGGRLGRNPCLPQCRLTKPGHSTGPITINSATRFPPLPPPWRSSSSYSDFRRYAAGCAHALRKREHSVRSNRRASPVSSAVRRLGYFVRRTGGGDRDQRNGVCFATRTPLTEPAPLAPFNAKLTPASSWAEP